MRCIYCNTPLAAIDYCPGCGADVSIQKRIIRVSNLLYNQGLEKATVRDLSGAITFLTRSLKFNKENTDARNLLGLCYFETGEVVSALCEWVISKNLKPDDNPADYYLTLLQNNKNRLDTINQTIRKYNQSLEYCRQNNEDMAIIQLKKVIAQNPKLVKAYQLLALLYMKHQEYERARRLLKKAAAIDNTNTRTLRYLTEIEEVTGKSGAFSSRKKNQEPEPAVEERNGTFRYISGNETIIQPTTFRDSSTVATFINIALGILLGGAIVWFMVVPANRQSVRDAANQQVTDANTKLASESARLQELQDEVDGYIAERDAANAERDNALAKAEEYDDLLGIASQYLSGQQDAATTALEKMDGDMLEGKAKELYDSLMGAVSNSLFNQYYSAGTTSYVNGDYAMAAQQLKNAVESDPQRTNPYYADALYYLGFAYYNLGDRANADAAFTQLIEQFPERTGDVQGYVQGASGQMNAPQGQVSIENEDNGGITAWDNGGDTAYQGYDPADVAWTDPYTGLNYDMYGNLLG